MNPRQVQRLTLAVAVGAILLTAVMVRSRRAAPVAPIDPQPAPALLTFDLPRQPAWEMLERPLFASDPLLAGLRSSNLTFVIQLPPAPRQRGFSRSDTSLPDPHQSRPRDLSLLDFRVTPPVIE